VRAVSFPGVCLALVEPTAHLPFIFRFTVSLPFLFYRFLPALPSTPQRGHLFQPPESDFFPALLTRGSRAPYVPFVFSESPTAPALFVCPPSLWHQTCLNSDLTTLAAWSLLPIKKGVGFSPCLDVPQVFIAYSARTVPFLISPASSTG